MNLKYASKTDVGRKRDHNEDSFGIVSEKNLFFVCDGMGGHAAGDYASKKAVETVSDIITGPAFSSDSDLIVPDPLIPLSGRETVSAAMLANRRLFQLAFMYPKLRGMGTTFASVRFDKGFVNIVNVGDSRVYRIRDLRISQLSVDHSWVEELVQDGEIKEHEADTFGKKNVITRAMGTNPEVQVDWKASKTAAGDIYLLCSDGLSGELTDAQIERIVNQNADDLDKAAEELVKAANEAGGSDNITVILVKAEGPLDTAPEINYDEIVTVSSDKDYVRKMDAFINKVYPPAKTEVPEGVEKEKKKLHQNPVFTAVAAVVLLLGLVMIVRQPWKEKPAATETVAEKGDILIRTQPSGAQVSVYKGEELLETKSSPADFLALDEGVYMVKVRKAGYREQELTVEAVKGNQAIRTMTLYPLAKAKISLGINPGFAATSIVYIDGEAVQYYGSPLTVGRIGLAGKTIDISEEENHTVSVEGISKSFTADSSGGTVNIELNNGKIIIK